MNTSNNNIKDYLLERIRVFLNWLSKHAKIVMPIVLLVCVLITVLIAVSANRNKEEQEEVQVATTEEVEVASSLIAIPEIPLEQDAIPEVNDLFSRYYQAMVDGDTGVMEQLVDKMDETEILRAQETSKYIESYPTLEVYTKVGPKADSYIAYVYAELKFFDYEKPIPGMQVYYVCTDDEGRLYINQDGEEDESELNYIREVNLQDDVVDLNNKAAVAYNDMLAEDENLVSFILDLNTEIDKNVGEALARVEGSEQTEGTESETSEEENGTEVTDNTEDAQEPTAVVKKVKATAVVNIRSSDSETADKLGKAAIGDEFELLEARGNGWSKIKYDGNEAFIKSDYLEASETEITVADNDSEDASEDDDDDDANEEQVETTDDNSTTEKVTVKETVRVRSKASEKSEKLGTAYKGEKLDLLMRQADGWTKIKYNGQTAYVKSEYVE